MPKALDITGQVFGNLKAISKAESCNGKTYWLCECLLCGNMKKVQTSHLTGGLIKSCGCACPIPFGENELAVEKTCLLCKKKFLANVHNRRYCYDCSPKRSNFRRSIEIQKEKAKKDAY